nr:Hsp70 family protein [Fructilactobacillus florum]
MFLPRIRELEKNKKITIKDSNGLSDEEIDKMMKEASANEEADKKKKETVDLNNEVDQLLFQTDKTLKDVEGKVSEDEIKEVKAAQEDLKKAKEAGDLDDLKAKKDALNEKVQAVAVKLYQQQQEAQGDQATGTTDDQKKDDGDTVNGDFHEVHDDDNK